MSNRTAILLCVVALAATGSPAAERVQCPTTADNWVESPPWNPRARDSRNHGTERELVVNGRNSFALLAFDMSAAKGLLIEKATLRIHRKSDAADQIRALHLQPVARMVGDVRDAERIIEKTAEYRPINGCSTGGGGFSRHAVSFTPATRRSPHY